MGLRYLGKERICYHGFFSRVTKFRHSVCTDAGNCSRSVLLRRSTEQRQEEKTEVVIIKLYYFQTRKMVSLEPAHRWRFLHLPFFCSENIKFSNFYFSFSSCCQLRESILVTSAIRSSGIFVSRNNSTAYFAWATSISRPLTAVMQRSFAWARSFVVVGL